MFELSKDRPRDVKEIRNNILLFIKEQLQKAEGGEGGNITGIYLFICCNDQEKHLYEWISVHLEFNEQRRVNFILTELNNFIKFQ